MSVQIGVLHSVYISDRLKDKLVKGLANAGWPSGTYTPLWPPENDGKYGHKPDGSRYSNLNDMARSYVQQHVDLIVAAGGLVAALAAYEVLNQPGIPRIPAVALVGREPAPGETGYTEIHTNSIFPHVVYLAPPNGCLTRRDALVAAFTGAVSNATTGLMVNTNSSMWDGEVSAWQNGGQNIVLKYPDLAQKKENNYAHFPKFFSEAKRLNPGLQGIVVSSDPYFYRYHSHLIRADNSLKISFPIINYKFKPDGSVIDHWDSTRHTIDGAADMLQGYYQLGQDAGNVLNKKFPHQISTTLGT
jgi:hypothetical protein